MILLCQIRESKFFRNFKISYFFFKDEFTKLFLIDTLISMYRLTQLNIHEYVLAAIIALIENNPNAIKQAKEMNLDFKNIISQRLSIIENDPSCMVCFKKTVLIIKNFILKRS